MSRVQSDRENIDSSEHPAIESSEYDLVNIEYKYVVLQTRYCSRVAERLGFFPYSNGKFLHRGEVLDSDYFDEFGLSRPLFLKDNIPGKKKGIYVDPDNVSEAIKAYKYLKPYIDRSPDEFDGIWVFKGEDFVLHLFSMLIKELDFCGGNTDCPYGIEQSKNGQIVFYTYDTESG